LSAIWALLFAKGVDIVLTGHDHNYQRWEPLNADGNPDPSGIVQFVVGSGGHGIREFERTDARVIVSEDSLDLGYGALYLELSDDHSAFQYVNVDRNVLDSGEIPCHEASERGQIFYTHTAGISYMRACPSTNCHSIATLRSNTSVTVIGEVTGQSVLRSSTWYEVLVGSEHGYMHSALLYPTP
jgi:hypothetical protein